MLLTKSPVCFILFLSLVSLIFGKEGKDLIITCNTSASACEGKVGYSYDFVVEQHKNHSFCLQIAQCPWSNRIINCSAGGRTSIKCQKMELPQNNTQVKYTLIIDIGPVQDTSSNVSVVDGQFNCNDITYDDLCPDNGDQGDVVKIILGIAVAVVVITGISFFVWRRRQQIKKGSLLQNTGSDGQQLSS